MSDKCKSGFLSKIIGVFNKIKNSEKGKSTAILVIVIAVILVIFIGSFSFDKKESSVSTKKVETKLTAMEYCNALENRLVNILENVKGIGKVEVFVMVDSSPEIKYLEEIDSSTNKNEKDSSITQDMKTSIVMSKNGSLSYPVVVIERLPKVTGVLIVSSGAKDVKLKTTLINVVSSILSVDISNVEVLEGKV